MQLKQEEFRISNASYSGTPSQIGNPASDYYTFTISGATPTVYTLIATAKGSQSGDTGCTILTINKADNKTPSNCWK
ncbi:hypothetical protein D3C85_1730120 [compost metagenome]